jgi:glycosyltransferase involved in cell wall biosynthesis
LSKQFQKVVIYPCEKGHSYYGKLPGNVVVKHLQNIQGIRVRNILFRYGALILKYYFRAFVFSKKRFKYVGQFFYSWNFLMGILNKAFQIEHSEIVKNKLDVCYSYWFNDWASALAICKSRGSIGKLICRAHGYDYDELQNGRGWFPFRESEVRGVDKVFHISNYGLSKMQQQYGAASLGLSRLGVEDFGTGPVLSKENPTYRIVSCSNFVHLKRIPLLIDVLSKLNLSFHWTHFGGGEGMQAAIDYAQSKLKQADFTFMGQLSNTEIIQYYRVSPVDLFINMSELEGIPVSMMEAISFGIPIAGYGICGIPEIVTKETGLLLYYNADSEQVASLIEKYLKTKARDLAVRAIIKDFWNRNFNAANNYLKFCDAI